MSELISLDKTGDTKVTWDKRKEAEVAAAEAAFLALRKKGYTAYSMNERGDQGELIRAFDPNLERIMMVPQMQGG